MIEPVFDFNTVGGVAYIYVIPKTAISSISVDYTTGLHVLTLSDTSSVVKIPRYADETFSFAENHGRDEHGDFWTPSVSGVIPKSSTDNAVLIEKLERGEWVVVTQDHNGAVRICGDLDTQLTFSTDAGSGATYIDRNQTAFTLTGKLGHPSWVIEYQF